MDEQKILQAVNASVGHILREQGLTAMYQRSDNIEVEDDLVAFVDADGRESVVSISVNSLSPSLEHAMVSVAEIRDTQLTEGWKHVVFEAIRHVSLSDLAAALRENEGRRMPPENPSRGLLVGPVTLEVFEACQAAAENASLELDPFFTSDTEGFNIRSDGNLIGRVECAPGRFEVIVRGEREIVPYGGNFADRIQMAIETRLEANAPRPF